MPERVWKTVHDTPPSTASPRPTDAAPPVAEAPRLALIAAVAKNRVIGIDNRLPWRLPEDLKRFRALTLGHSVIMGRRTFESIGRPLRDRQNIVVSRTLAAPPAGAELARSLDDALSQVRLPEPAFVIGGEALYREALARAELLHLTEIERDFAGDAWFPEIDRALWRETSRTTHRSVDDPGAFTYHFATYERTRA